MQRTVAQCTPNPARANRRFSGRTRPFFAFAAATAAALAGTGQSLGYNTQNPAPPDELTPVAIANPSWQPAELIEILRRIYEALRGDLGLWEMGADSPCFAMALVIAQYDAVGVPAGLPPQMFERLVTDIDRASCMLQSAPPTEDPALIQQMQDALFGMWIELGQPIGELGC